MLHEATLYIIDLQVTTNTICIHTTETENPFNSLALGAHAPRGVITIFILCVYLLPC